jgi:AraC family transcriptional regulator
VDGVDDDPTLRSLLSRLIGQMAMWNAAIAARSYHFGIERGERIASMRAAGRGRIDVPVSRA